ncbi:pyridoxamine 5'-phosphate oxidase family protein [Phyllobacterium sp. 21LDTY02-6]|uniref:pyridoxamine 5'-phosphate oxidase family protein n=1 Tax=Phyllobacterium sp. 21LDTY02-6 TaxID=2944903 RepID=UPI00202170FE|nr:pyridoxamine 5'-phosphate oxidase family protein [Phyllobacterium sp. 21LDTY02-6]MCO4319495.1 pyridoxamine 5'-phosphate oxidase family protein [Phyllobacterium sp. 21LDTY02-6]
MAIGANDQDPWHDGEIALQRLQGVAERMAEIGRKVIRRELIDQHREFYPLLPMAVLGAVDPAGDVWASVRAGYPGFLASPDPQTLHVELQRDPTDPADAGMEDGAPVALLGIDLRTRRRNRLNGRLSRSAGNGFDIGVEQSFGNCPKYIQLRSMEFVADPDAPYAGTTELMSELDRPARELVGRADTFFVASYVDRKDGARQVDVSHRGGRPGFIRLEEDGSLAIPEFTGNRFYNTLGNILANGRAGLVFVENGQLLQMTGEAEIVDGRTMPYLEGAELFWRFRPRKIQRRYDALPLRLDVESGGWSPNALATGIWNEVRA